MLFSGRAYYNLLWLSKLRGQNIPAEDWESFDYRGFSTNSLFALLQTYHIYFDSKDFILFCDDLNNPEDLIERLDVEEGELKRKVYIVIFELWRRLLPEKGSISIFCDELDHLIASYKGAPNEDALFDILNQVLEILDRNTEMGQSPREVFSRLCLYIAHNLENVIYTYIDTRMKEDAEGGYLSFIDHFMPYVEEKRALQFLKLKALSNVFAKEKESLAAYLVHSLQESSNFSLSVPMLFFLIEEKYQELFSEFFSFLVEKTTEEKKLVVLLDVLMAYHREMGQVEKQGHVHHFLTLFLSTNTKKVITVDSKQRVLSLL